MKVRYPISLAIVLMLTACSSDDVPERLEGDMVPISLTACRATDGATTRAASSLQSTSFDIGEEFYAFFPTNVTVGNATNSCGTTFTKQTNGDWTPASQPYFNYGAQACDVHAYYGKSGGSSGTQVTETTQSFSVALNQENDADYKASDLMYASISGLQKQGSSVTGNLTFAHKMTQIKVVITPSLGVSTINAVKIVGGYQTVDISMPGCTIGNSLSDALSTTNFITMYSGSTAGAVTCYALIPPQTVSGDFLLIETDAGSVTYSLVNKTFNSSNCYTFNLAVTAAAIGTTVTVDNWTDNGSVTVNPTGVSNAAICEFTVQDGNGADITNTITYLTVSDGTHTYKVSRSPDAGPISVVMEPVTSVDLDFTAANDNTCYFSTVTGKTLQTGYRYPITIQMSTLPKTFDYTGSEQILIIPKTGWYNIEAYGAEGGKSFQDLNGANGTQRDGGLGGKSSITYYFTQGQTLYIYCGGKGGDATCAAEGGGAGGWNGGGRGGNGYNATSTGGGGGGGATHVATTQIGCITSTNSLYTGNYVPKAGLLLVAGGGGGNSYNKCVAGAGGGNSWTVGKRASDGSADNTYTSGSSLVFTGSQGGNGKNGTDGNNARGGSGGHGGGFKAVASLSGQFQTYAGCGASGWGESVYGQSYTTTAGQRQGNGQVIIKWYSSSLQGADDYNQQDNQTW